MTKLFFATLMSAVVISTAQSFAYDDVPVEKPAEVTSDLEPIRVDPTIHRKKLLDDETARDEQFLSSVNKAAKTSERKPASD